MTALASWENFYVIVGSFAGGLIGLIAGSSPLRQIAMSESHRHGALTNGGSAALHRAVTNATGGKKSGNVGFKIIRSDQLGNTA